MDHQYQYCPQCHDPLYNPEMDFCSNPACSYSNEIISELEQQLEFCKKLARVLTSP